MECNYGWIIPLDEFGKIKKKKNSEFYDTIAKSQSAAEYSI